MYSIILILAGIILAGAPSVLALPPQAKSKTSLNARFDKALSASNAEIEALINIKDHKGESLFNKQNVTQLQNEDGLWAHKDPVADQVSGTSTEKLYRNIRVPHFGGAPVIVAVIDSGIDIRHQDLRGKIWVNEAEFYGKAGVDDDSDGYIDDVFGWNFLGNKNGTNVGGQTLELTREYKRMKLKAEQGTLSSDEQVYFEKLKTDFDERKSGADANLAGYSAIRDAYQVLKAAGLTVETVEAINALQSTDETVIRAKALVLRYLPRGITSSRAEAAVESLTEAVQFHYNLEFESSAIVGDNPNIMNEKGYGNPDVQGPDASHGTHVAGIIGAIRNNKLGIDGQAANVKIMAIRAVPNGDERDKDVGNAIRYAVDHGAKVINMSFGKDYVANKAYVDSAVMYAAEKGVLLVHAAGNDGKSTESYANNYPNRKLTGETAPVTYAQNWLEIGASDQDNSAMQLPAEFSNFGKTAVDIFAPGVGIVSSIPGNRYAKYNGTSMASPEAAGVAALLMSKFPQATVAEIKDAILSTANQYEGVQVKEPGSADLVPFANLSVTGGTVNAYRAMLKLMSGLGLH